jgi:hypothetical protein
MFAGATPGTCEGLEPFSQWKSSGVGDLKYIVLDGGRKGRTLRIIYYAVVRVLYCEHILICLINIILTYHKQFGGSTEVSLQLTKSQSLYFKIPEH